MIDKLYNPQKKGFLVFIIFLISVSAFSATSKKVPKSRFEKLELFNKVLHLVESQYYREVDTEKLIEGALKGMMETLDPHSSFLNKKYFSKMQEETQGEFGGLGIEVTQKDGLLVVITPIEDTPAHKAGLKPRDKIVEINHESVLGITLNKAVTLMRGKPGSKVKISVKREGSEKLLFFTLKREIIKTKPVKAFLIEDNFAFIRLIQFQKKSGKFIISNLKKLKKQSKNKGGIKGIILDLRQNPGGLLDEAVNVSSIFLKEGIVVSTEGRNKKNKDIRYVKKIGYKDLETPLIVLVNSSSASASEIVAGALQDYKRAIIMGEQSFGKGSVQTVAKVDGEVGLKLTIAQYMTPLGRKIQAVGIKPDIKLDELDAKWAKKFISKKSSIRERDLRNHLTAAIETDIEKKIREKREKDERIARVKSRKTDDQNSDECGKKSKKEKNIFKKYNPKEDYQVLQAINFLRGFSLIKNKVN